MESTTQWRTGPGWWSASETKQGGAAIYPAAVSHLQGVRQLLEAEDLVGVLRQLSVPLAGGRIATGLVLTGLVLVEGASAATVGAGAGLVGAADERPPILVA